VAPASGPETRTIAIALGTRPDDNAKIVCSLGCIAYLPFESLKRQRNFICAQRHSGAERSDHAAVSLQHLAQHLRIRMLQKSTVFDTRPRKAQEYYSYFSHLKNRPDRRAVSLCCVLLQQRPLHEKGRPARSALSESRQDGSGIH
jgi:hypothetical protein